MTTVAELPAGFADKVLSAQATFRSVMDAMARPGQRAAHRGRRRHAAADDARHRRDRADAVRSRHADLARSARCRETPDVAKWLKFHTSAPVVADPSICSFALIGDAAALPAARSLRVRQQRISRSLDHADPAGRKPDRRAGVRTARPRHRRHRDLAGHDPAVGSVRAACRSTPTLFPRGIDVVLVADDAIVAIPRTTRLVAQGRLNACMSPSREANAPSRTPIGCWRMSAAAIASVPEVSLAQISEQLSLGVDRVMTEGSLYDRELAALAIKQARGDMIEAIFLVRAFRATLPRFGATEPVDTGKMQVRRRISSTFKDIPGGQILGPDLRLHPSAARSATRRRLRARAARDIGRAAGGDAARHRHSRPRRPDRAVAAGRCRCAGRRPHARAAELSRRPRSAAAESGARRRGLSAGARLFVAARLWPQPSVCRRNPARRGRGRILRPKMSALRCRSARSR